MKKKQLLLGFIVLTLAIQNVFSQAPKKYHAGEIRQLLEKLNVLGSVLYVAAHPDDENTRLITYYANEKHFRTGYLSATRGDGGQNLVGPEIREKLGLIRTHELLAARKIDGGVQFFSRANDFGFSKSPEETFNIWEKEKVLEDFVWIFRTFKPDIVITRFNTESRVTHGHHTASALLAKEAFKLSGDENAFPEQLEYVSVWQPKKLYWNTSWWFYRRTGKKMDTSQTVAINVGKYNPLLGKSYTEIAAESRSMHKSQGFGATGSRGDQEEYLIQWEGEKSNKTPFDDIDTSWKRIEGGENVAYYIEQALGEFDETDPERIVESLLYARKTLQTIENDFWKQVKTKEIDNLLQAITGLYVELVANDPLFTPNDSIGINLEVINRSDIKMNLEYIKFNHWSNPIYLNSPLVNNKRFFTTMNFKIPENIPYSNPYWLNEKASLGMYNVEDLRLRGMPINQPALSAQVALIIENEKINYKIPVIFKRNDPVAGEVYEPISIGYDVMINVVSGGVMIFGDDQPKTVDVKIIAGIENVKGSIKPNIPKKWSCNPKEIPFSLTQKREEQVFSFDIFPPKQSSQENISFSAIVDNKEFNHSMTEMSYDHFPKQTIFSKNNIKVIKLTLEKKGQRIGYIKGAGDAIPDNLRELGYQVDFLAKDDIEATDLKKYDAVILGIRAFNTVKWLSYKNQELFKYVYEGGNLIVQYNTSHRLVTQDIAPYPLTLSRDRVTVEESPIRMLSKNHAVLSYPNTITESDFENWVQERGLYFPNKWSKEFIPILSSNDPDESPKDGGLLVAKHGKGYYVYSGYSWFRQLPAGVPGAYRLFINLISIGK